MRISDWSSDVCSSDLQHGLDELRTVSDAQAIQGFSARVGAGDARGEPRPRLPQQLQGHPLRARDAERNGGALRVRMLRHERSEEHTSELQSLMRISYAVFCLKKKKKHKTKTAMY